MASQTLPATISSAEMDALTAELLEGFDAAAPLTPEGDLMTIAEALEAVTLNEAEAPPTRRNLNRIITHGTEAEAEAALEEKERQDARKLRVAASTANHVT